ncbi:MAG: hypothetical protein FJY77_04235 [Candidatus Altiarchaeales archaeon]|nr:hypothetical protein [Candidatus Altiarchaeales archaeon]
MKKGIVFTIGLALLALTVLTLATTMLLYRQSMQDLVYAPSAMERAYNTFHSAADDLKDIVLQASGVAVTVDGNDITFTETIPNPNVLAYQTSIDLYANFISSNVDNLELDLNHLRNTLTFVTLPQNVSYTHNTFGGKTIYVLPSTTNLNYSLSLQASENVSNCTYDIPPGDNTMAVYFEITGNPGSCTQTLLIDPSTSSSIYINEGSMTVSITPGGRLSVQSNLVSSINLTTTLHLAGQPNNNPGVYLPDDMLTASLSDYGMEKRGYVKIA